MNVSSDKLETFAAALLHAGGFTKLESEICAKSLVESDLAGVHSHGVVRVCVYLAFLKGGEVVSGARMNCINEGAAFYAGDANKMLGQVAMPELLDKLYERADSGVVTGTLYNSGHIGRLAQWVIEPANNGFAALVMVQDNGAFVGVAPAGCKNALTSTNPIAFAAPLGDGCEPFVFDTSTSASSMGKMNVARLAGQTVADGILQDEEGRPANDPSVLFKDGKKGTILPMAGHRGFGLSMMVDILTAGLSGGFTPPAPSGVKYANNVIVTLWNPERFSGLSHMQDQANKYIDNIKSNGVRISGERSAQNKKDGIKGGIDLNDSILEKLTEQAKKLNVELPNIKTFAV